MLLVNFSMPWQQFSKLSTPHHTTPHQSAPHHTRPYHTTHHTTSPSPPLSFPSLHLISLPHHTTPPLHTSPLYPPPPPQLCTRGRVHIFKRLEMIAAKEDKKRGILSTETEFRKTQLRKPSSCTDFRYAFTVFMCCMKSFCLTYLLECRKPSLTQTKCRVTFACNS